MSYQVLARKWRPRTFSEMVGQQHVVRALSNALESDRLHHAYLFTGTRGVGKTTLARIFAKSLNCEQGVTAAPCGECSACREIDEGRFIDLLEVDAASRTKVDQTRELLENVPYAPVRGRYKVYLIDEVHMFSAGSFNALLKTLEEPPPHVKFLLATTDPQKMPVTVLSRCLQFNLKRLLVEQIREQLQHILKLEKVEYELPALTFLAQGADGSMRDALSLMDQAIALGGGEVLEEEVRAMLGTLPQERVYNLLSALADLDAAVVMEQVTALGELTPDYPTLLQDMLAMLHRVALAQAVPASLDAESGDKDQITNLADLLAPEDIQLFYQIGMIGQRDLQLAPDPRTGFEMILLRMIAFRPMDDDSPKAGDIQAPSNAMAKSISARGGKKTLPDEEAVTTKSGDISIAGTKPGSASGPGDLSQWDIVVKQLDLGGIALQLANNCLFSQLDGDLLELKLDPAHKNLWVESTEQRLCRALEAYTGKHLKLSIRVEDDVNPTPAQLQAQARDKRQHEAEKSLATDPLVQAMEQQFDARLMPDSIQPIDE